MDFSYKLKIVKRFVYLETLLGIITFMYLYNVIRHFREYLALYLFVAVLFGVAEFFAIKRTRQELDVSECTEFPDEALFNRYFDKYGRRLINWSLIFVLQILSFSMNFVSLWVNSKAYEILETLSGSMFVIEIVAFFLIKNAILFKWFNSIHEYSNKQRFVKAYRIILICAVAYLIVAMGLFFAFESVFVLNIYTFLAAVFTVGIILVNLTVVRKISYNKSKYVRLVIAVVLVVAIVAGGYTYLSRDIWLTQPYINSIPNIYDGKSEITYDDESGIYTITKKHGDFKILQLTDIHLGGGVLSYDKDIKALEAVFELIDRTRPDFVIVTGDLVFPVGYASFSFNNTAPVQQFAAFMRNLGVPWAFTYGNHDTESYAATKEGDLNDLYMSLSWKTSKTLLYPYVQPDIMGRSNQVIELRNPDGSMNQALFLIDSNAYTGD
ncbi:MAG: metallophosphoesterase, partial [Lachnospiraceae bacterium]|nr:metallophosphoesterase [Lachnospiraceae bacterium]